MPILETELLGYWVSVIADIVHLARYETSNRSAQGFRVKLGWLTEIASPSLTKKL